MKAPVVTSKHLVLVNDALSGFPYGMQRDFEYEIIKGIEGEPFPVPLRHLPGTLKRFTNPATRYRFLTDFVPSKKAKLPESESLWVVLMGPEANPFWFFKGWDSNAKKTILYLFDTFEAQVPLIQRMLINGRWDLTITSFPAAVPMLEQATKRKWHAVMQGVHADRFRPLPETHEPTIAFSSYGRRWPALHAAIKSFCQTKSLHYDYTVASDLVKGSDPCDNYEILAWHLRQSWFTVCWPVELTNPKRVLSFSPITCRWFEAAASGSVVIGQPPTDPKFSEVFGEEFVERIDPHASPSSLQKRLEELWERRDELRKQRIELWRNRLPMWTWETRVQEIQSLASVLPT